MNNNCPFCDKDINKLSFSESENFYAIYNIAPILPGHSLIIPKKHIHSLMEFTDMELSEFILFSREVTKQILLAFNSEGFDFSLQEKEEAGQSIEHFHFHIIPRKPGDLGTSGDWYEKAIENEKHLIDSSARERLSQEELEKMVNHIKKFSLDTI